MKKQCCTKYLGIFLVSTSFFLTSCDKNNVPGDPIQEDSILRVAEKFQHSGDLGASLSFYKQIIDKEPENTQALMGAATVSWKSGDYPQAHQYLDKLLILDPTSFSARRLRGKTFLAQEKASEALGLFQSLSQEKPQDASLLNLQGVCYDLTSDHNKARTFYEKALLLEPKNMGILSNLGLSLTLSGKYDEAKKILEQVKDMSGITSRERHNLAIAYGLSGDLVRAEHIFRIDLDAATTRKNIERLAGISGAAPGAPAFVEKTIPLSTEPETSSFTPLKKDVKIVKKAPPRPAKKALSHAKKETPLRKEKILPQSKNIEASPLLDDTPGDSFYTPDPTPTSEEATPSVFQENSLTSESILDR